MIVRGVSSLWSGADSLIGTLSVFGRVADQHGASSVSSLSFAPMSWGFREVESLTIGDHIDFIHAFNQPDEEEEVVYEPRVHDSLPRVRYDGDEDDEEEETGEVRRKPRSHDRDPNENTRLLPETVLLLRTRDERKIIIPLRRPFQLFIALHGPFGEDPLAGEGYNLVERFVHALWNSYVFSRGRLPSLHHRVGNIESYLRSPNTTDEEKKNLEAIRAHLQLFLGDRTDSHYTGRSHFVGIPRPQNFVTGFSAVKNIPRTPYCPYYVLNCPH